MRKIRIGTRSSALALRQTEQVASALKNLAPDAELEIIPLRTKGDRLLDRSLADFGGKGAFVAEFEEALLSDEIDLAVHSAKDLPAQLADGLYICATPKREDPRDVLLTRKGYPPGEMPIIGTSSPRRAEQIRALFPAEIKLLRGNVPTRIQKLKNGEYDGILLAAAGLKRLGLMEDAALSYRIFSCEEMIPAAGQGIIAVEGRLGDEAAALAQRLTDSVSAMEFETERFLLARLGLGCHDAAGVFSSVSDGEIRIDLMTMQQGMVQKSSICGPAAERLELAEELLLRQQGKTDERL